MFALLAAVFSLYAYGSAQSTTSSMPSTSVSPLSAAFPTDVPLAVQGEAIVAHFTNSGLIPSLFKNFTPVAVMSVSYNGVGTIAPGQNLTVDQIKSEPTIALAPLDNSASLSGSSYTLAMLDAGVVGDNQSNGQKRHWLVNGVTITGSSLDFANSTNITDYVGPNPPVGEGAHRYVFALFFQPKSFTPTNDLSTPGQPVAPMDISQYINGTGLGPLIAGMYLETQRGVSTATFSPTSPVITSTLPGFPVSSTSTPAQPTVTKKGNSSSRMTYSTGLMFSFVMTAVTFIGLA